MPKEPNQEPSQEPKRGDQTQHLSRRSFCGGALTLVCAVPMLACEDGGQDQATLPPRPTSTPLDEQSFALLIAVMDALIPASNGRAGAVAARAPWYVAELLGAFDSDPPKIFAGGPYSGRHGGLDGFRHFQRLTRVEEIRWRTTIEGSRGIPEREFNGPVVGLRERYETGLRAIDDLAQELTGARLPDLDIDERRNVLQKADPEFLDLVYGHANEGTYGDPVYGGNFELKGWDAIDYEGDRVPQGYSAKELIKPEDG